MNVRMHRRVKAATKFDIIIEYIIEAIQKVFKYEDFFGTRPIRYLSIYLSLVK